MNKKIISYLQSVEISHSFAVNYNHGVQLQGKWDLFEPTRFVYAFFAFNMIYAIDWDLSLQNDRLNYQKKGNQKNAKMQMQDLINFIVHYDDKAFENALEEMDNNRDLYSVVSHLEEDYNSIQPSVRRTGNTIAQDFLIAAKRFSDHIDLSDTDHFDLLQMSYTVRNNIFHGEKKAQQMKEKGHRKRLLFYGNIILATNESFFNVMRDNFNYRRIERGEVEDNL